MRFLLVDQILELEPAKHILAETWIDPQADYFADHFPGYPIVPGVLLVEMIAQAAGKCLMASIDSTQWPVLIQISSANFRKSVSPGVTVRIDATIHSCKQRTANAQGYIICGETRVVDASLMFGFIAKDLLAEHFEDPVLRRYLDLHGKNTP